MTSQEFRHLNAILDASADSLDDQLWSLGSLVFLIDEKKTFRSFSVTRLGVKFAVSALFQSICAKKKDRCILDDIALAIILIFT